MKYALLLVLVMVAVFCAPLRAAEDDDPPEHLAELLERADRGAPLGPDELAAIERFARYHLFRVKCNVLDDARFSIAQLQVKAGRGGKAVETLKELVTLTKDADVKSVAQYDIGKVYRVCLRDPAKAEAAFKKVTGRFAVLARRDLVRMYAEARQPGKAILFLQGAAARSKEKGEKLALLRQLAELCQRTGRTEDAIGAFRRITEEFTQKDIETMNAAAARRVDKAFEKARALQARERGGEVDLVMQQVRIWVGQLAAAGRVGEFRSAREALERGWRRMERREGQRDGEKRDGEGGKREGQRDGDRRDGEGGDGERRRDGEKPDAEGGKREGDGH